MQIETAEQLEAATRLRQSQRIQRLRKTARGVPWCGDPTAFLLILVCGGAWVAVAEATDLSAAVTWGMLVVVLGLGAIQAWLARRVDAVVELLDLLVQPESGGGATKPASLGRPQE